MMVKAFVLKDTVTFQRILSRVHALDFVTHRYAFDKSSSFCLEESIYSELIFFSYKLLYYTI